MAGKTLNAVMARSVDEDLTKIDERLRSIWASLVGDEEELAAQCDQLRQQLGTFRAPVRRFADAMARRAERESA